MYMDICMRKYVWDCVCVHLCEFKRESLSHKYLFFSCIKCPITILKCFHHKHVFDTQCVVLEPAAWASHGNCQQCRILVSNPMYCIRICNLSWSLGYIWEHYILTSTDLEHCCYYCIVGYYHLFKSLSVPFIAWRFEQHRTILPCVGFL